MIEDVNNNLKETNSSLTQQIESINVEQYILDSTSDKALKAGVGKVYGGVLNGSGNLSIAGHNEEGKFKDLEELDKGDKFVVVDRKLNETTYKIVQLYKNVKLYN